MSEFVVVVVAIDRIVHGWYVFSVQRFVPVPLRDDTDKNIIMQISSCFCHCSTNPYENALYACTCSSLHSLQNNTSKL
jgi:hypothetical protein